MYDPYFIWGGLSKKRIRNSKKNELGIIIERFPIVIKINININKVIFNNKIII